MDDLGYPHLWKPRYAPGQGSSRVSCPGWEPPLLCRASFCCPSCCAAGWDEVGVLPVETGSHGKCWDMIDKWGFPWIHGGTPTLTSTCRRNSRFPEMGVPPKSSICSWDFPIETIQNPAIGGTCIESTKLMIIYVRMMLWMWIYWLIQDGWLMILRYCTTCTNRTNDLTLGCPNPERGDLLTDHSADATDSGLVQVERSQRTGLML